MSLTLTVLTPMLAFAGALLGVVLNRRGARELERRSMREETMRNVRWAAELAVAATERHAELGVSQLVALDQVADLDDYERTMVRAALARLVTAPPGDELGEEW